MLAIIPLGSWYYLKKGLDYRKNALTLLSGTDSIYDYCGTIDVKRGETIILADLGDDTEKRDFLKELMSEFDDIPNFYSLVVGDFPKKIATENPELFRYQNRSQACNYAFKELSIIDTSGIVRRTYPATEEGFVELVEHLSIVIPAPEERDIKFKEYEEK
jgi:hypothetical protein